MSKTPDKMAQDGYRPITEGYQPGSKFPLQKGYTPTATINSNQQQNPPKPPSGGSSASKPALKQKP